MQGLVFDIKHYAIHDGPGIRTTIFLKGCPMHCLWCHNPESQDNGAEAFIREKVLDNHKFHDKEEIGKIMSVAEIMEQVNKDRIFTEESGGGVTVSGGEPLMQPEFLLELLISCKKEGYHTAIDTCGHAEKTVVKSILDYTDLFLYDLKLIDNTSHEEYTGVTNIKVMENLEMIMKAGSDIILRFPVIPGITDTEKNLEAISGYIRSNPQLNKIDLLPYHAFAKSKYRRLEREYQLDEIEEPCEERISEIIQLFEGIGMETYVGGR
jgi:pyruvate formate lyase activating enzyme